MELNERIKDWYNSGKDFFQGLSIYMQSTQKNKNLINVFSKRGETLYTIGKLEFELLKQLPTGFSLQGKVDEKEGSDGEARQERKVKRSKTPQDLDKLPKSVQVLYEKRNKLYRERDQIHSTLELLKTDEERKEGAKNIIKLQSDIDDVWKKLDLFRDSGIQPVEQVETTGGLVELMKRSNSIKTYISKYKKQIKNDPNNANFSKWEFKLEAFINELEEINGKINQ